MSEARPLRVAVVGSGPAGFYAAGALLASEDASVEVDLIERLPTPWGLVRLGVAPDHPNIKVRLARLREDRHSSPGFRFLGNVSVGEDVTHEELTRALRRGRVRGRGADRPAAWASPARTSPARGPRRRSWPGTTATPTSRTSSVRPRLRAGRRGRERQRRRRRGAHAGADCRASSRRPTRRTRRSRRSSVLARAGDRRARPARPGAGGVHQRPSSSSWPSWPAPTCIVDPADLELDPSSEAALADDSMAQRNLAVLRETAATAPSGKPRAIRLRFCASPAAILGDGRVEAVEIVRNELVDDGRGGLRASPTEDREVIPCGAVLRSVGYRGVPLPGVPFDEQRGMIRTRAAASSTRPGGPSRASTPPARSSAGRAA